MARVRHQVEVPEHGPFCLPEDCDHRWVAWIVSLGQYRCCRCLAYGYAGKQAYGFYGLYATHTGEVTPYRCFGHRGRKKCRRIATIHRGTTRYCDLHATEDKESVEDREFYDGLAKEEERIRIANDRAFKRMQEARKEIQE